MPQAIYADNAATSRLSRAAYESMQPFLLEEFGNPSQPYSFSRSTKTALKEARESIATCINARPEEIFFTSGGTESDNWAIKGSVSQSPLKKTIITSSIEHHAILNSCNALAAHGCQSHILPVNGYGTIQISSLKEPLLAAGDDCLVSAIYANNEIGTIQPIGDLCLAAHEAGAVFHTDAVQAVGHIPVDVQVLNVDMLSASAHKFNGPRGIGFLYIKNGIALSPLLHGGKQESDLRAGTENVAAIVGMAVALKENCDEMSTNADHLKRLEGIILRELDKYKIDYQRNGKDQLPGLLSLSFPGCDGEMLLHRLDLMGISVSTGAACDGADTKISHVLEAIGLTEEYSKGTIRISLGKQNSEDDVVRIAAALKQIIKGS